MDPLEKELRDPTIKTVLHLIGRVLVAFWRDPVALKIGSAFVVLMLWGYHGEVELLGKIWPGWTGPGSTGELARASILPGIPWDQEWISFGIGVVLVVLLPLLLGRLRFGETPSDYGLGLPPPGRRRLAVLSAIILGVAALPGFWLAIKDPDMRATYPFYRDFASTTQFVVYELGYFAFFVVIEFIFRGYLLFGLHRLRDRDATLAVGGAEGSALFGNYAILISMLSYTAWHLGKPVPELFGTLVWGLAAGAVALAVRSIWPLIVVHWALNVLMDWMIWRGW